ncbi:hypothetical protein IJV79_04135 [bacterium]|nr:hypothetical protein [bacterium]
MTRFDDNQQYIFVSAGEKIKQKHFYLIYDGHTKPPYALDEMKSIQLIYPYPLPTFCIEVVQKNHEV